MEELKAAAEKAGTDAADALNQEIETLKGQVEELTKAADFENMDETGLLDVVAKLTEPLKKLGYDLTAVKAEPVEAAPTEAEPVEAAPTEAAE